MYTIIATKEKLIATTLFSTDRLHAACYMPLMPDAHACARLLLLCMLYAIYEKYMLNIYQKKSDDFYIRLTCAIHYLHLITSNFNYYL